MNTSAALPLSPGGWITAFAATAVSGVPAARQALREKLAADAGNKAAPGYRTTATPATGAGRNGAKMTDPVPSAAGKRLRCEAWCDVAGTQTECDLQPGHSHEHEAMHQVEVWTPDDVSTITNFIVWWGNDGHVFVGSDKAVDTGKIT